jgi:hypothetical protein
VSQTVIKRKRNRSDILDEKKEVLKEKKIAFFNKAVWKPWANVLGVLALTGVIFLASLFI